MKPIDANQVDFIVETWQPLDGAMRTIGLQLKSTINPEFVREGEFVAHDLEGPRYNRLLEPGRLQRYLVVVAVDSPAVGLVRCEEDLDGEV